MNKRFNLLFYIFSYLLITFSISIAQQPRVVSFSLINADNNRVIQLFNPIQDNQIIDYAKLPSKNLNIRANINPEIVGSVVFKFDGNPTFRVENTFPYTLMGDDTIGSKSITPSSGIHIITCTPFSGPDGTGNPGRSLTLRFRIIDSRITFPIVDAGPSITTNFPDTNLTVSGTVLDNGLPDPPGRIFVRWSQISGPGVVTFRKSDSLTTKVRIPKPGTYKLLLTATDGDSTGVDTLRIIVRKQPDIPGTLKLVQIPGPDKAAGFDYSEFVVNRAAAIKLGKILFWDMQAGSDGIQACASCHFHAGADNRSKNQMSPGLLGIADKKFMPARGPNYELKMNDFPIKKADDDIVASQGVFNFRFMDIIPGKAEDKGQLLQDTIYNIRGKQTRKVQTRNTPSVINAVYNYRNNWAGDANAVFNGINPLGTHDRNARLLAANGDAVTPVRVRIPYSSLASQATGPTLNDIEMSFHGRIFPKVGKKLLYLSPLAKQTVDPTDSQLGGWSAFPEKGLIRAITYDSLIRAAFNPKWWKSGRVIRFDAGGNPIVMGPKDSLTTNEFTLMEANFSLFWGLALQEYQATLVSDDSKYDQFMEGMAQLSEKEQRGMNIFMNKGSCINCHSGPEFTNASVTQFKTGRVIDRMMVRNDKPALYDIGYYNIGVRHLAEDPGASDNDKFGFPIAYVRQALGSTKLDTFRINTDEFTIPGPLQTPERIGIRGSFKVPTLRNVELTGPFFHSGGKATLREVIEAYNVGNNFRGENINHMPPDITFLDLKDEEIDALEAFLLTLTDERVRKKSAPFDHPQLIIPNGHKGNHVSVFTDSLGRAEDVYWELPAVGAAGGKPILPFLQIDTTTTTAVMAAGRIPSDFRLEQNYPNPFNPTTVISYSIPAESNIKLVIFNAIGQEVATLVNFIQKGGRYEVKWNAGNIASGVYIYRIEASEVKGRNSYVAVKKMLLIK